MKRPVLLYVNLGTPASTTVSDVRKYLREFLSDPLVIDIPKLARWFLVNFLIVPFRAPKTARAYRKIWRDDGSPLLIYSERTIEKLRASLADSVDVELAMRYGAPAICDVLERVLGKSPDQIYVLTAYPQYALSSTETALQEVRKILKEKKFAGKCDVITHYEIFAPFVEAVSRRTQEIMKHKNCDHVLFSFHGLPMRQIAKVSPNLNYRDQCFATAHAAARRMGLSSEQYSVGFQSRLGAGWIQPYSDELYPILARSGVRRLAVVCPSFTADCLETLEEVAIRGRETFIAAGGEDLHLVPCVNDGDDWIAALTELYRHGPWRALNA